MAARSYRSSEAPVTFVISVAAELAGMHPQTLRQYDRLGLVSPARAKGRGRRYTKRDIQRLQDVQRMSQDEGINLAGIRRILELERQVERLEAELAAVRECLDDFEARRNRVFTASTTGEVSSMRRGQRPWREASGGGKVAVWRPWRTPSDAYGSGRKVRAVIEAGPSGVRIIDAQVSLSQ